MSDKKVIVLKNGVLVFCTEVAEEIMKGYQALGDVVVVQNGMAIDVEKARIDKENVAAICEGVKNIYPVSKVLDLAGEIAVEKLKKALEEDKNV